MNNDFKQTVILKNRSLLEADGVEEVIGFDETNVALSLGDTEMIISGSNLSVVSLDSEKKTVVVKGEIEAVIYSERQRKTFLKKLWGK